MAERPVHVPTRWYPECAQSLRGATFPPAGSVIAYNRGVWTVTASRYLTEVEWTDADHAAHEAWKKWRRSTSWPFAPHRVEVEYVGGVLPDDFKDQTGGAIDVHPGQHVEWWIYPHGRWPKCSCCGEPMPCRAELADLKVDAAMQKMEELGAKLPGCCWSCGEPVTRRHKTVRYAGENLDLPGGPGVVFHARQSCWYAAEKYEARWLKADRSRRRILTYPKCRGWLVWHQDGSSECSSRHPDCHGYLSHDHGSQTGCDGTDCRKGCDPHRQGWCNPKRVKRPTYRDPDLPQDDIGRGGGGVVDLLGGEPVGEGPDCPGMLVQHRDGTAECTAGGRDDCWDGSKYRHQRVKSCRDLSHGCPKCETYEGLA